MALTGRQPGRSWAVGALALGGVLLALAVLVLTAGAVRHFDGYAWSDEHEVAADGTEVAVRVDPDRETLLWALEGGPALTCSAQDREGDLELRDPEGDYQRPGGSVGDWTARAAFTPRDDLVTVRCETPGRDSLVMVEARPRLPAALAVFGAHATWGLGAAGLGLVAALAAPLLARRRATEEPTPV